MSNKLETAVELYLKWRSSCPRTTVDAFLREHAEHDEYLRPMLVDQDGDGPGGAEEVDEPRGPAIEPGPGRVPGGRRARR